MSDLLQNSPEARPTAAPGFTPGAAVPTSLVLLRAVFGQDEANYDTKSYPVGGDGLVQIPSEAAGPLLEKGGFVAVRNNDDTISAGNVRLHHDYASGCSYRGQRYACDRNGNVLVPVEAIPELLPHGFVPLSGEAPVPARRSAFARRKKG